MCIIIGLIVSLTIVYYGVVFLWFMFGNYSYGFDPERFYFDLIPFGAVIRKIKENWEDLKSNM